MAIIKILGICGSLRKNSYNLAALKAAGKLVPSEAELETLTLEKIPMFQPEHETDPDPEIKNLREKIRAADAILFVSPEYNFSVPGVLKNAIDAASRPYTDNVFIDKPVAIMGASTGMIGTARMQYHLRQIMVFSNAHVLNRPEVFITFAADKINGQGELTDQKSLDKIKELLEALVAWTKRLNPGKY